MTPRQGDPAEATPVRQPIGKLGQINESLIDIQNIMRKNIDEVVQRVEKLDRMVCRVLYRRRVRRESADARRLEEVQVGSEEAELRGRREMCV